MSESRILEPNLSINTNDAHTEHEEFLQQLQDQLIAYVRGKAEIESIPKVVTCASKDGVESRPNFVEILKLLDPIHLGELRSFLTERKQGIGIFSPTTFLKTTPATALMLLPILLAPAVAISIAAGALAGGYNIYTQSAHQTLVKQRVLWLLEDIETALTDPTMLQPIDPPKKSWGIFKLFSQTPASQKVLETKPNEETNALLKKSPQVG